MYAARDDDTALAESVFHDVPVRGVRRLARAALTGRVLSRIAPVRELRLIALHGYGLKRLGVTHGELIEAPASAYAWTAEWGAALHAAAPDADGIVWMARRFTGRPALILFGDRVGDGRADRDIRARAAVVRARARARRAGGDARGHRTAAVSDQPHGAAEGLARKTAHPHLRRDTVMLSARIVRLLRVLALTTVAVAATAGHAQAYTPPIGTDKGSLTATPSPHANGFIMADHNFEAVRPR